MAFAGTERSRLLDYLLVKDDRIHVRNGALYYTMA